MRKIHFRNDNGYESLADCIVLQAVKDYSRSYKAFLRNPLNRKAEQMMNECEDFFESGWFRKLCDMDPEELLYRIEKDIEYAYYTHLKPEDVDNMRINRRIVDVLTDYERCYKLYLKDPEDKKALKTMEKCEGFLISDPKVRYIISDPIEFFYEFDQEIEEGFAGGGYGSDQ